MEECTLLSTSRLSFSGSVTREFWAPNKTQMFPSCKSGKSPSPKGKVLSLVFHNLKWHGSTSKVYSSACSLQVWKYLYVLETYLSNGKGHSVVRGTLMWINRVAVWWTMTVLVHEHMLVVMWHHVHVWSSVFMPVCVLMWMYVEPTFLTVMFVLMQYKAMATLTNVRAHCVDALVLAAAVVLAALIFVCERHTCNTSLMWRR